MDAVTVETPIPLVDLDRLDRNLERMADYASQHRLSLRPHSKTHKSQRIAAEQIRRGAVGLTCATILEMEVMAEASNDLLLAYPAVGEAKLKRLLSLPDEIRITVMLDSHDAAEQLAAAARKRDREVGVLIELDAGMHRVGLSGVDAAVDLTRMVTRLSPLVYCGIGFYPGHLRTSARERQELEQLSNFLSSAVSTLERSGVRPDVVSGGSTPLAWQTHNFPEITEMRPGTYVYNDRTTQQVGACEWTDCALTVLATVVSTAVPGQAVIDAGSKSLGREPPEGQGSGFGALLDRPEVVVTRLSEEHGILDLRDTDWRPSIGDQVRVVPNHACYTVCLHEVIYGVRGDRLETSWPVTARGRRSLSQSVGV